MRLKEVRQSQGLTVKELLGGEMHKATYSLIETGKMLPTVDFLRFLCSRLECMPLDLYESEEIDLPHCMDALRPVNKPKADGHKLRRKKTFRLSDAVITRMTDDVLHTCGYSSWQSWFDACVRRLFAEYAARCRKGEKQ